MPVLRQNLIRTDSDLETTLKVCTHPIPESQRRAIEKVAGILFPNVPELAASTRDGRAN